MNLLEVAHLSKKYPGFALQDISFSLPSGYIMGYVGQNGAGKTTTLNAITHLNHCEGTIQIDGIQYENNPVKYLEAIGFVGDSSYFPEDLNLRQIRSILKDFYSTFRPEEFDHYVKHWRLPERARIKGFSRGMKVKLMFASILSRDTKLLVLDEATNGLDPMVRKEILGLLQEYISDGSRSVLFSTHILEDLEQIADFIFLINEGKKIFCDTKEELLETYLLVKGGREDLTPELKKQLIGLEENAFGFEALYSVKNGLPPAGWLSAKPSIDQIVVHIIEDMR